MTAPDPEALVREWLAALRDLAAGRQRGVLFTHDNPDPDAMASAVGMAFLLDTLAGVPCDCAYGGIVGRAENRAVLREASLPLIPDRRIDLADYDLIGLVDTQPEADNHCVPAGREVDIVVDHHPLRDGQVGPGVAIVSGDYGATSSLITALLRVAGLEPSAELATALFYGVKTDTQALGRESYGADAEAYEWLFPRSDQELLARIEHPKLPRQYFRSYHRALEQARLHGNVVVVDLGDVYTPEIVPQVAEHLIQFDGAKWSVAAGIYRRSIYVSVRTDDRRMNAGKQVREVAEQFDGSAGGHGLIAGARFTIEGLLYGEVRKLLAEVLDAYRAHFGGDESSEPLVR